MPEEHMLAQTQDHIRAQNIKAVKGAATMAGYALIELLLALAVASVLSIKAYQVLDREMEQYALDRSVAAMRILEERARSFQYRNQDRAWPANIKVLEARLGIDNLKLDAKGFSSIYKIKVLVGNEDKPDTLQISALLPEISHARYIADKLGHNAWHSRNTVYWAHVPTVRTEDLFDAPDTLDADLDLSGHSVLGWHSANSDHAGVYDLRSSIIKVDRVIARSISSSGLAWVDQDDGPPLYRRQYPGGWHGYFKQYIAPDLIPTAYPPSPFGSPGF
jgi:type II secretory pathway pseudopilin PulG